MLLPLKQGRKAFVWLLYFQEEAILNHSTMELHILHFRMSSYFIKSCMCSMNPLCVTSNTQNTQTDPCHNTQNAHWDTHDKYYHQSNI